jgi:hypothetical protein
MKILKRILLVILLLIIILVAYLRLFVHESPPTISTESGAENMTQELLNAVNKSAWDTLSIMQWTFRDSHHYLWDKKANNAIIKWGDYEVHLNMDAVDGRALCKGVELSGKDKDKVIQKAWSFWCNDSFWLAAPFKIKDPGTQRYIATDQEGKQGLLVQYASGGVTPGDQYLWYMDEQGLPTGYKMWVKILPVGGVYTSWEDWQQLPGGAKVASRHKGNIAGLELILTNIKGGEQWAEFGHSSNPINTGL